MPSRTHGNTHATPSQRVLQAMQVAAQLTKAKGYFVNSDICKAMHVTKSVAAFYLLRFRVFAFQQGYALKQNENRHWMLLPADTRRRLTSVASDDAMSKAEKTIKNFVFDFAAPWESSEAVSVAADYVARKTLEAMREVMI